jgi:hypothetical protein
MDDGLRLRRPDRSQMSFGLLSPEDLVAEGHPVRAVWKVVESLDLSAFLQPLKARAGVAGRDGPGVAGGVVAVGGGRGGVVGAGGGATL